MKRPYETTVVFDGTLADDVLHKEQAQLEELLRQNASLEKTEVWGKRAMAYPIRKKRLGHYCLFLYQGESAATAALERQLRLNERVLRYLTIARDPKNEAARAAFFARREKAAEEAAKAEAERAAAGAQKEAPAGEPAGKA